MRSLLVVVLASCTSTQPVVTNRVAPRPHPATLELTERGLDQLVPDSIATLADLRRQISIFDVRERKLDDYWTAFDVFDRGDLLYTVFAGDDHAIFAVMVRSPRIVVRSTGWRVGGVIERRAADAPPTPTDLYGCTCGNVAPEDKDLSFAYTASAKDIRISLGKCTEIPERVASGIDFIDCPIDGTIGRIVWFPAEHESGGAQ